MTMLAIAALACAAWTFALLLRDGFWRADFRGERLAACCRCHAGPE